MNDVLKQPTIGDLREDDAELEALRAAQKEAGALTPEEERAYEAIKADIQGKLGERSLAVAQNADEVALKLLEEDKAAHADSYWQNIK